MSVKKAAPAGGEAAQQRGIPVVERIVAAMGAVIVMSVFTFLGVDALMGDRSPPDIRVEAITIEQVRNGYLVQVRAINDGGRAAAQVELEGMVIAGDGGRSTARLVLDYVPGHSEAEGGMLFDLSPRDHRLKLRALGYATP